jgi:hypothetical protein
MLKKILPSLLFIFAMCWNTHAQTAYQHISDHRIYNFIEELANLHLIDINSAIKPYSRSQIGEWLVQAQKQEIALSEPEKRQLHIFLEEFALETGSLKQGKVRIFKADSTYSIHLLPPEFTYRDAFFRSVIRPIYGFRYISNANDHFYTSYGGLEGIAYLGKNWCGYASLRDNHQSSEPLNLPDYFTPEQGGNFKNGNDFSEMRGGITFSTRWGSIGLLKDNLAWGDNHNGSNIFSGHSPSFPMIKLHLNPVKWLEFEYYHGWLISQVIDSTRSFTTANGDFRAVFRQKYIASNMYTFKPFRRLNISIGNSIIYSDVPVQPAYLIPFFLFKSVDHTLNHNIQNQNSMIFLNISSRQIKHLQLFTSVYIDEFSIERVGNDTRHNFVSMKGGFALYGWPLKNLGIQGEYTRTTPNTFEHYIETTTYASNYFNLGHYMRSNSQDLYASVSYSPYRSLRIQAKYIYAMHANDYEYNYNYPVPVDYLPVLQDKTWTSESYTLRAELNPLANLYVFAEFSHSNVKGYDVDGKTSAFYLDKFSPAYLRGITNTLSAGVNLGF